METAIEEVKAPIPPKRKIAVIDSDRPTHTQNVFVYGSLRKGGTFHHVLDEESAVFLSTAQIVGDIFPTSLDFPCLMEGSGLVDGEVYAITKKLLRRLDFIEGHPQLYERTEIQTTSGLTVWVYFGREIQQYILQA